MGNVKGLEELLRTVFSFLIVLVEACGGLVITIGVCRTIVGYLIACVIRRNTEEVKHLRIMLGQSMVLALEFQVAADILKTGLSPTWQDILLLAAIIAVRTVMNILLERELEFLGSDRPAVAPTPMKSN